MLRQPTRTFALLASAARTNPGNSGAVFLPEFDFDSIAYKLSVPNGNGAGGSYLDLSIQTSDDGGTTWWDMVRFSRITASLATGSAHWAVVAADDNSRFIGLMSGGSIAAGTIALPHIGRLVRAAWDIGGAGATWTFQIDSYLQSIGRGG